MPLTNLVPISMEQGELGMHDYQCIAMAPARLCIANTAVLSGCETVFLVFLTRFWWQEMGSQSVCSV